MDAIERMLAELREENAAADRAAQAGEQEKALRWLDRLDPESNEGEWFERFAERYESRLDAATAYLRALGK